MVERCVGLAHWIVRLCGSPREHHELLSSAYEALIRAAQLHDPGKGKFSAYAASYIRFAIMKHRKAQRDFRSRHFKVRKQNRCHSLLLFSELGDRYFTGNRNLFAYGNGVADDVAEREAAAAVRVALAKIRPRQAMAIRLRYGIDCEPHTLEAAGEKMGVDKENLRQMVLRGERSLQQFAGGEPGEWRLALTPES